MQFDKELYRERRSQGLSGQEQPSLIVGLWPVPVWPKKSVSKKALRKNTKRARKVAA